LLLKKIEVAPPNLPLPLRSVILIPLRVQAEVKNLFAEKQDPSLDRRMAGRSLRTRDSSLRGSASDWSNLPQRSSRWR